MPFTTTMIGINDPKYLIKQRKVFQSYKMRHIFLFSHNLDSEVKLFGVCSIFLSFIWKLKFEGFPVYA